MLSIHIQIYNKILWFCAIFSDKLNALFIVSNNSYFYPRFVGIDETSSDEQEVHCSSVQNTITWHKLNILLMLFDFFTLLVGWNNFGCTNGKMLHFFILERLNKWKQTKNRPITKCANILNNKWVYILDIEEITLRWMVHVSCFAHAFMRPW